MCSCFFVYSFNPTRQPFLFFPMSIQGKAIKDSMLKKIGSLLFPPKNNRISSLSPCNSLSLISRSDLLSPSMETVGFITPHPSLSRVPCTPHVDYPFPYACLVIPYVPSTHSVYISQAHGSSPICKFNRRHSKVFSPFALKNFLSNYLDHHLFEHL